MAGEWPTGNRVSSRGAFAKRSANFGNESSKYADAFKPPAEGQPLPKEPPRDERYMKDETAEVLEIRFR